MHRKNYEDIADAIASWRTVTAGDQTARALICGIADDLATVFERDNERFDRDKFLDRALPWTVTE